MRFFEAIFPSLSTMFHSGSQATLVNPQPPIEFVCSKHSVLNTLLLRDGKPCYSISTLDKSVSCTRITDLRTQELLVTIQRRWVASDAITFTQRYGGDKLKLKEWLRLSESQETASP